MKTIIRAALSAALALAMLCGCAALAEGEIQIVPAGAQAVEIVGSDGSPITRAYDLSIEGFYLVGSDTAELRISADGVDPAVAALYSNHDNTATALAELARDGETYLAATGVDSLATTGYESTMVGVMPGGVESGAFSGCVLLFCSEDDLNFFCANRIAGGASWHSAGEPAEADAADPAGEAEGTEQSGETEATEPSGEAVAASADYAIAFVDEAGNPVAGVVANVCDDVSCTVVTSDAGGRASFSLPSYAYDVHVIQVPEGYAVPGEGYVLPAEGGEITISLSAQ